MEGDNWVLFESAAYLRGKGISFGGSLAPPNMKADGVYSIGVHPINIPQAVVVDKDLSIFASESLDHVYIGPGVEVVEDLQGFLREACSKLKIGGHLIVFTRIGHQEPGVLEIYPQTIEDLVGVNGKWQKKTSHEQDEASLQIYKRLDGRRGVLPLSSDPHPKRACVVRYGAIGDAIIISPLIRKFKEDGYEVTVNINPYCKEVFKNNPHIDNLLIQEREVIPNNQLTRYWAFWESRYNKYINLSESLEGDLLIVENRPAFFTHKEWRHKKCNKNYYDYVFEKAGYGPETFGQRGEMFFTSAEERKMQKYFQELGGKFVVLWALNGSSHHKVYPLMEQVLGPWFQRHPDSRCITTGDYMARLLEPDFPQMCPRAGEWTIRESLLATKYADLVIGPETAITNGSGCFATPKIILLSHSTKENLTKYFENDFSLEPSVELAPCYPCHQLHYTKESCPIGEIVGDGKKIGEAPICTLAISPERLLEQMEKVYSLR